MLKRHAIQVLRQAGHSLPEVAKLAEGSVRSVQRVGDEEAVSSIDNEAERIRRKISPADTSPVSKNVPCWPWYSAWKCGRLVLLVVHPDHDPEERRD